MSVQELLRELEHGIEDELASQVRVLGKLEAQESAIKKGSADGIVATTAELEAELERAASRGRRRQEVLRKIARAWGVAVEALTLSSIVERARGAGLEASRLASLRGELRATMALVVKRSRLLGTLAHANAVIIHEAIEAALRASDPRASTESGSLVNAEG